MALDVVDCPGPKRFAALTQGFVERTHGLALVLEAVEESAAGAAEAIDGSGGEGVVLAVVESAWAQALEWLGAASVPTVGG